MSGSVAAAVSEERLVEMALRVVGIPSPTGHERRMAAYMRSVLEELGLQVAWQEVERGRPNVLGRLRGAGDGPTLMFNGHMDTSYSGREPWLRGIEGFQPKGFVRDGHVFGLGISNMKGALCCYVEALRALREAGVALKGDVLVAAVVGEIEKAQWGEEFRGGTFRGYGAGSQYLVRHGGVADMCVLGEPTGNALVLAHFGTAWLRISTRGPFVHTAFSGGRLAENAVVRMREVLDEVLRWIPTWEERGAYDGRRGIVNVGSISGGAPWRASRTPARCDLFLDVRVPPSMAMAAASDELNELGRALVHQFPEYGVESELYVSAPGAEIAEDHPLVLALARSHESVFGTQPERDVVHWFSDASVLSRYGIETVNYGPSSALPGAEGESMAISALVDTAKVYALAAARICEVAE